MSSQSFAPNKSSNFNFGGKVPTGRQSQNLSQSTYKKDDLRFSSLLNTNVSTGKSKQSNFLTILQVLSEEYLCHRKQQTECKILRFCWTMKMLLKWRLTKRLKKIKNSQNQEEKQMTTLTICQHRVELLLSTIFSTNTKTTTRYSSCVNQTQIEFN